jgi:hypothetical protein
VLPAEVLAEEVAAEVAGEIAPSGVDVVGVVLVLAASIRKIGPWMQ